MTKYYQLYDNNPKSRLKNDIIVKITGLTTTHSQFIEGTITEVVNTFFVDKSGTLNHGCYKEVKRVSKHIPMMVVDVSDMYQPDDDDEDYYYT